MVEKEGDLSQKEIEAMINHLAAIRRAREESAVTDRRKGRREEKKIFHVAKGAELTGERNMRLRLTGFHIEIKPK